ncbi:MAG: hypothetical protein ABWY90_00320, partial [Solirubrobacterales bacterium]
MRVATDPPVDGAAEALDDSAPPAPKRRRGPVTPKAPGLGAAALPISPPVLKVCQLSQNNKAP